MADNHDKPAQAASTDTGKAAPAKPKRARQTPAKTPTKPKSTAAGKAKAAASKPKTAAKSAPSATAPKKTAAKPAARKTSAKTAGAKAAPKPAAKINASAAPEPARKAASASKVETPADNAQTSAGNMAPPENGPSTHEETDKRSGTDEEKPQFLTRVMYMFMFGFLGWLATVVGLGLAAINLLLTVIQGKPNDQLRNILVLIGDYVQSVFAYLSFETDHKPFPLDDED